MYACKFVTVLADEGVGQERADEQLDAAVREFVKAHVKVSFKASVTVCVLA